MRILPEALAAHIEGQATTLCHAWRVTRRDDVVFGFTDHDAALVFDGTDFSPASGFQAAEVESALGLSVDTGEVAGAFSDGAICREDLAAGRFDGARIELFAVNWADAEDAHLLLHVFELGEVTEAGPAFRAELRGLAGKLDAVQGRVYGRRCDADLGDARCGVDLERPGMRGAGAVIACEGGTRLIASGLEGFQPDWFRHGLIRWESGANARLAVQVLSHRVDTAGNAVLDLWNAMVVEPEPGDVFSVTAGCEKSFGACRGKFGNGFNFQGFPHLPGADFAYGYAGEEGVHDGAPVVP